MVRVDLRFGVFCVLVMVSKPDKLRSSLARKSSLFSRTLSLTSAVSDKMEAVRSLFA